MSLIQRFFKLFHRFNENTYESNFKLARLLLVLGGYNLFQDKFAHGRWFMVWFPFAVTMHANLVGCIMYINDYARDMMDYEKSYLYLLTSLIYLNRFCWFISKKKTLKDIIELNCEIDELVRKNPWYRKNYATYMRQLKNILKYIYFSLFLLLIIYLANRLQIQSMVDPHANCIIPCMGLRPVAENPKKLLCRLYIIYHMYYMGVTMINFSNTFVVLTGYSRAIFNILTDHLVNLNNIVEEDAEARYQSVTPEIRAEVLRKHLHSVAHVHALVLRSVKNSQDLFSTPIGIDFGLNAMMLCIIIILPFEEWVALYNFFFYSTVNYFSYCYFGERLEVATCQYEEAVYCCGWEYFNVQEQKTVLLIYLQALKAVTLKAFKIIPISYYTFANLTQIIYRFGTTFKV